MKTNKQRGAITIGPKDNYLACIPVTYVPTPGQIMNLQDYFGWDFIADSDYDNNDNFTVL